MMRVVFTPPSEEEFKRLFLSTPLRKGGGFEDISVFYPNRRRGGGILSTVSGVARRVLPFLYRAIKPAAREFGKGVFSDLVNQERPLKDSLKKHGLQAVKTAGMNILRGTGRKTARRNVRGKRRRKSVKRVGKRRKVSRVYKSDVFSLL